MLQGSAKDIREVCHYIRVEGEGRPKGSEKAIRLVHTHAQKHSYTNPSFLPGTQWAYAMARRPPRDAGRENKKIKRNPPMWNFFLFRNECMSSDPRHANAYNKARRDACIHRSHAQLAKALLPCCWWCRPVLPNGRSEANVLSPCRMVPRGKVKVARLVLCPCVSVAAEPLRTLDSRVY
ncbi:hypothetical protein MRX96_004912 [Rhipicephalus microplus]